VATAQPREPVLMGVLLEAHLVVLLRKGQLVLMLMLMLM
jgi:hypothetical protein